MTPVAPLKLTMLHVGGELRDVIVTGASEDGVLHVRWTGGVGSGTYSVHVFRTLAPAPDALPGASRVGFAWLYRTPRSRTPLDWQAKDPEGARELWRKMTGRSDVLSRAEWFARVNGKKFRGGG